MAQIRQFGPRPRRPINPLVGSAVLALLVSIGWTRVYWGYWFHRPATPAAVGQLAQVTSVSLVECSSSGQMSAAADVSPREVLGHGQDRDDSHPQDRLLAALHERRLLPDACAPPPDDLPSLLSLISDTGRLVLASSGYHGDAYLGGVIIDGHDRQGTRLVLLGLGAGQVSNDHHPYYELVLRQRPGEHGFKTVFSQRFFYDVAGLEGMRWYSPWLFFFIPAAGAWIGLSLLGQLIGLVRSRRQMC